MINPATKTRMTEWAHQQTCPKCETALDMKFIVEVKPIGSFSLAGATMKFSASEIPVLFCPSCGEESRGTHKEPPA